MSPANISKARTALVIRPVVQSLSATRKLASSLRRLGADEATVTRLTEARPRPATS